MKKQAVLLWLIGALALAACQQNTPQNTPTVLGTLELTIGDNITNQAKFTPSKLGTQALVNEAQLVFTPTAVANIATETNGTRNFSYVSRHFTITNKTGSNINNLTLVALAKTGNLGGTAIKTASAFNGNTADAATAQLARPTHTMKAASGVVSVDDGIDISRASFQALTTAEATAIQNDPNFTSQGLTGTVLEYGFAATNNAANSRTIPSDVNNPTGKVSIAMRFPTPTTATGTYSFTMTFAVTAESTNRVTRSPEELLVAAQARASTLGATQTVQIDDPAVVIPTSALPVYNNIKIGTGVTQTLLKNAGKVVVASVYGSAGSVYAQDFAEFFNAGEFSVSLTNTSLQYGTRSITTPPSPNLSPLGVGGLATLNGVLGAGQYLAIQTTSATPDATLNPDFSVLFPTGNGFSNSAGGKVAFVKQSATPTALNCTATNTPAACSTDMKDLLGFTSSSSTGGNIFGETAVFIFNIAVNSDVVRRKNNGCTDSDNNANDFEVQTLSTTSNPARNKSSPRFICP